MPATILVVEDELALRETLSYNLKREGYLVSSSENGKEAVNLARQLKPDLILLDLMLPGIDGLEVTRVLRQEMNVPIIMITAKTEEIDRVLGLEIGADDYVTKPFSMRELLARVKATLRRVDMEKAQPVQIKPLGKTLVFFDLEVDVQRHEARLAGKQLPLKPKEYDLLVYMTEHKGQVLPREMILKEVWGWDYVGGTRTVDVHVRWLREKIEKEPENPTRIVTVRSVGYRFEG